MTADPYAGTAYEGSREGWWTKYGGARDSVSGVVYIPAGADHPPCPYPCAHCRRKGLQPGGTMGKPQIERPTDMRGDREWFPGTIGDDLLTVHKFSVTPMVPRCRAEVSSRREVSRWQRVVNCPDCLATAD